MTTFSKNELLERYLGKGFDVDNFASFQCFDAPIKVARDMLNDPNFYVYVPNDKVCNWVLDKNCLQKWLDAGFLYEKNDFTNPNQIPKTGDFVVFNATPYNGFFGHTGIMIDSKVGENLITIMDQNAGGNCEVMSINSYPFDNLIGWIYAPQKTSTLHKAVELDKIQEKPDIKYGWDKSLKTDQVSPFYLNSDNLSLINSLIDRDKEIDSLKIKLGILDAQAKEGNKEQEIETEKKQAVEPVKNDEIKLELHSIPKFINDEIKASNQSLVENTASKPFYKSKKVWAGFLTILLQFLPLIKPEYREITNQTLQIGIAYLIGQSAVDVASVLKK